MKNWTSEIIAFVYCMRCCAIVIMTDNVIVTLEQHIRHNNPPQLGNLTFSMHA